jgi:biotin transport system substrate-specific component
MTATTQPDTTQDHTRSSSSSPARDIALVAAFAALISASAYIGAIPVGSAGVPITLQTLTVMLAGCVLGPVRGFSAVTLDLRTRALVVFACSITASILVIHLLGILGMKLYFDVSFREAGTYDMPFWIGDLVKTSLVAMIAAEVHRAFPQLLHRD